MIKSKHLIKDFEVFLDFLEAHPDPFAKVNEAEIKLAIDEVKATLSEELSTVDYYKKLSSIVALIKDGHSSVYMPEGWLQDERKERGSFPYEVFLDNNEELYVIKSLGDSILPLGSKILSINGMAVKDFVDRIDKYISYETKAFRNTLISRSFNQYLFLEFEDINEHVITYFHSDTEIAHVKNIDYKTWKSFQKNDKTEREKKIDSGQPYDYDYLGNGVGYLKIFSFATRDIDSYKFFLSKTFSQIKKKEVHSLIIDVRGNFGGWPKVSSELFHYLSEGHFKTMAQSEMKVSNAYKKHFTDRYPQLRQANVIVAQNERHTVDLKAILENPIGSFKHEDLFYNESPITKTHEFKGDVYLLTNRDSFSAASSFAATFKCYQMGKIVGEPTGGTLIFRANPIVKVLPKSKIAIRLSTTKLYSTCFMEEDAVVYPDITIGPSILDLINDLDPQLRYTQMLIKKIRKQKESK